ncbi:uncharacterized protein LOC132758296 [Ruditapes philippinarum]|uniref:uncharacterized protein LOC132758296 n=1 Tax=Ruditapes philippinarum TaxID=129788 RepID=UPI00295C32D3|nr:uncharacterized protein LOC132758296 [Ruditapes philippinarum]
MDEDEPGEGLDDLRKKRLAYFQTLNNYGAENVKHVDAHEREILLGNVSSYKEHKEDNSISNGNCTHEIEHKRPHFSENVGNNISSINNVKSDMQTKSSLDIHNVTGKQNHLTSDVRAKPRHETVLESKTNVRETKWQDYNRQSEQVHHNQEHQLKTSSFFFSNPEHQQTTVTEKSENKSDNLDAYNETVERLIKATKEELLGIKVSDDIWTNFRKDQIELTDDEEQDKKDKRLEKSKMQSDLNAQSNWTNVPAAKNPRDFKRSFSESGYSTQKDMNGNITKEHEQKQGKESKDLYFKTKTSDTKTKICLSWILEGITKAESPRPKLNRPKYEPPTIYQERSDREENHQEKKKPRDMNLTNSKNYEQVTVPRNVAFSSNEIYNQAYGSFHPGQAAPVTHQFQGGPVIYSPYSSPPGTATNGPVTPSTPVGPAVIAQNFHNPDQLASQEFNNYKSYSRQASFSNNPMINPFYVSPPPHKTPGTSLTRGLLGPNKFFPPPYFPNPTWNSLPGFSKINIKLGTGPNMVGLGGAHAPYMQVSGSGQVFIPHPPTSLGAQVYQPGHTTYKKHEVKTEESQQPPPTPSTSNAEVQTDREDFIENEKATMVEESTFTSVSQIVDEDKFIPHPPAKKKEGGPSPRRAHLSKDITPRKAQDAKRHIDGIRQHHEQRRQQYEGDKLSEEQIIERQKKFAKASLDRYFSSLENIFSSSSKVSGIKSEANLPTVEDEDDLKASIETDNEAGQVENTVIDDVLSNVHEERDLKVLNSGSQDKNTKTSGDFVPVVHGFVDFSENEENKMTVKAPVIKSFVEEIKMTVKAPVMKSFEFEDNRNDFENERNEFDNETLVNSMANTDATLHAGGLTERLNELGIDVSHVKYSNKDKKQIGEDKKHGGKKGKVLIVCPDCGGLNKEYMSWCTQCGEMIIGVEPMLVSKNRDGKIRMKPVDKNEIAETDEIRIKNPEVKEINMLAPNTNEVDYVQEVDEKPFSLDLDGIKSEKEENIEVYESKKVSPIKSEGRDSGRPSSDDPDLELQTQKIEEEVVNDICASISDPVLKGYMKSHFSKSKSWHDNEGKSEEPGFNNDIDMFQGTVESKNKKNFESRTHHDVVNFGFNSKGLTSNNKDIEIDVRFSKQDIKDRHRSDEDYNPKTYETPMEGEVQAKIAMFNQKQSEIDTENDKHLYKHKSNDNFEEDVLFEPPPLPNFSSALPVSHNELKLKLPANSMDYSTDMSQVVSQNFDNAHNVTEKGDNIVEVDKEAAEERDRQKAERRKERRRKRGHGAIDVEVFGYEESRESRNSSRANRMVPLLNLAGNSSDEDDSILSDTKPDYKPEVQENQPIKQKPGSLSEVKASVNAWGPAVIHEESNETDEQFSWQQPIRAENNYLDESPSLWKHNGSPVSYEYSEEKVDPQAYIETKATDSTRGLEIVSVDRESEIPEQDREEWKHLFDPAVEIQQEEVQEPAEVVEDDVEENQPFLMQLINQPKPQKSKKKPTSARGKPVKSRVRQSIEEAGYQRKWSRSSTAWSSYNQGELNTSSSLRSSSEITKARPTSAPKSRFNSSLDVRASGGRNSPSTSIIGQKRRPGSAPKSRVLSSDVQASVDTDMQASLYQDARVNSPSKSRDKLARPSSAPKSRTAYSDLQASVNIDVSEVSEGHRLLANLSQAHIGSNDMQASVSNDENKAFGDVDDLLARCDDTLEQRPPQGDTTESKKVMPSSSESRKRKFQKKKTKKNDDLGLDLELELINEMVEHRLPKPSAMDRLSVKSPESADPEHMASPRSTYDKYIEMTPRIQAGTVSRWQCLPDEILIHVFSYLDQSSLTKCAQVCQQYYRVAMDESLWKYITIKKNDIDDSCLEEIAKRHPVSLALIQCQGERVTARALRDLFRECSQSLKELNIARCSRGALNGDSLLLHAAARCHNLTHIDASWCSLTDSGLMAISNSCNRLESLCINGCSAISNDGLETVMKKHGVHLRVLEMFGCFNLSPRGLRSVANNCINLITLNLGQCYKLTDSCISQLSTSLGRVEWLDLRGCKQIKDNCMRRIVKNCTRLKHLSLANCPNITDVSILEISTYLTDIRSIDLCGCKNITDGSIRALVNTCSNLRHIDISSTSCTHRSVSMIANFSGQRLETLKINFLSDVTEQSLIKLAKHCHRLQTVHMYGCTSVRNIDKIKEERPTFTIEM